VSRPLALLVALLAAAAALVTVPLEPRVATAAPEMAAAVDASAQGGDSYFPWDGNGGYDVRHYRIEATVTPRDGRLRAATTLTLVPGPLPLRSFSLDLALTPDWVKIDGRSARFSKPRAHELRVVPATPLVAGREVKVAVGYHGRPADVAIAGVSPFLWAPGEAMAVGEPQIGAWWFPANEHPSDKASYDVTIRVPRGKQAVSNGHLVSRSDGRTWTTWRWRQHRPIATYLAFFAAGSFEVRRTTVDGRPTVYAVSKKLDARERDQSFRLLQRTPGIVRWLEDWLGPYPYGTSGGVVSGLFAGFALENAGRPTYPFVGGPGSRWNLGLVVHEMAHQWFGNDVSLRRWRDIWLNEGLASYAEWAYAEDVWGQDVQTRLVEEHGRNPAASGFWKVSLTDPGAARLFDTAVYERGAMAVAALRCRIGVSALDTVLRRWAAERSGGHGTVPEFLALAQEVSGQDLADFFVVWLDERRRPSVSAANGFGNCA
jgi:aminopeptidase N